MRVKKFVGNTIQEAIECLKREFGRDAIILQTSYKRRWFFGRIGKKRYEVLGAIDPAFQRPQNSRARVERAPERVPLQRTPVPEQTWTRSIQTLLEKLINFDIPEGLAQELLKDVLAKLPRREWSDLENIWDQLTSTLTKRIATVEPWEFNGEQRVVALIGPTGVGKTTTVAKLAANFALVSGKKVGIVTVDTYRIAAVEQLKTYADIIGIPVYVAYSPVELQDAVSRMQDRDLILVDTAGRSPNNYLQIAELKNYLEGVEAEVHLVISATTKQRDVDQIIRIFSQIPIQRIIITKLDETNAYGIIYHASSKVEVPIAFVTTGQGVPEDIEVADSRRIAELVLGEQL